MYCVLCSVDYQLIVFLDHVPFRKDPCYSPSGKQGFSPQSPADIQLGDVVKFFRPGGRISCGVVRYIGHLPGKDDTYLGVEYEQES